MNNTERIKNLQANSGKYFILTGIWTIIHIITTTALGVDLFGNSWAVFLIEFFNAYTIYKIIISAIMFGKALTLLDLLKGPSYNLCKKRRN